MKTVAKIINLVPLENGFYQLTLYAPILAVSAIPGHFIHLENEGPFYILNNTHEEIQFIIPKPIEKKIKNKATVSLSSLQGASLTIPTNKFHLLLIENNALAGCLFYLRKYRLAFKGLIFIGTHTDFPFLPCPTRHLIPQIPTHVIAGLPLLVDWGIPHCLTSLHEKVGCFQGTVVELANKWITQMDFPMETIHLC